MFPQCVTLIVLVAAAPAVLAEVVDAAPSGFHLRIEKTVDAAPDEV